MYGQPNSCSPCRNARQHMVMEERIMFPAALNALHAEDWADIALKWADRYDRFYQPGFEQKFYTLRRNILEMELKRRLSGLD
jgi:hypothetical protein